jgi:hypothetical protein
LRTDRNSQCRRVRLIEIRCGIGPPHIDRSVVHRYDDGRDSAPVLDSTIYSLEEPMTRLVRLLALGALVMALSIGGVASAQDDGTVTVVHGVPGLTVDVYVNGDLTLEGFEPGAITDPLALPAGTYDIEIRAAGAAADSDPAISGSAQVAAGINATVIAHLTADGTPTLGVFVNDVSMLDAGESRLTVRHTAAAPAVDVWADGQVLISDFSNPEEASLEVPAATYSVAVSATGSTDPVLGPVDLQLSEGTAYFVYAIGSLEDGTLDLLVQTVGGLHSAPHSVPAGLGGTATTSAGLIAAIAAMGAMLAAGTALAVRRRTTR